MGASSSTTRVSTEAYPSPIKVNYLPGAEVVRNSREADADASTDEDSDSGTGKRTPSRSRKRPRDRGTDASRRRRRPGTRNAPRSLPKALKQKMLEEQQQKKATEAAAKAALEAHRRTRTDRVIVMSWGWGGEGRTGRGRFTSEELTPQQMINHDRCSFIGVAAGKRHSLLLTDWGQVFSTGEGRGHQLGVGRVGGAVPVADMHRFPRPVLPSGELRRGVDLCIAQVQAGATSSFAREASEADIATTISSSQIAVQRVDRMLRDYPDNENLFMLRAYLIEESRTAGRRHGGNVLSWGSNAHGQLGHGKGVTCRTKPTVIPALSGRRVTHISAGKEHVLAVTYTGELYVWGCGRHGRLGLGDYQDRWTPTRVKAWGERRVTPIIAAGFCHSLAVIEGEGGAHDVYCWGKGANGRLGDGRNLNRMTPTLIELLPASLKAGGFSVEDAALGGAHTLILFNKREHPSLRNPWGVASRVFAWGANAHGQLGVDNSRDRSSPVRVCLPEYEVVTRVCAGKLHSAIMNAYGELFTFGRGFFGELGQGDKEFRYKPTKVDCNKVWLDFAGGHYHSLAIAAKDRNDSRRQVEKSKFDYKDPCGYMGLRRAPSVVLDMWDCARQARAIRTNCPKANVYSCVTCNMALICKRCALSCHRGHQLDFFRRPFKMLCECGVSQTCCKLLPTITEERPDGYLGLAVTVQRLARGHQVRRHMRKLQLRRAEIRTKVCERLWMEQIIHPVFEVVKKLKEERGVLVEHALMAQADHESLMARHYLKMQRALQRIDAQKTAIFEHVTKGMFWPTPAMLRRKVGKKPLFAGVRPFFYATRQHLRQYIRAVPLHLRPSHRRVMQLTKDVPAYGAVHRPSKITPDPDIAGIVSSVLDADSKRRNRASIAGPEGLYARLCRLDGEHTIRVDVARRHSFDWSARVQKHRTAVDARGSELLSSHITGVNKSLEQVRSSPLEAEQVQQLSRSMFMVTPEGSRAYVAFTRHYASPGLDADVAQLLKPSAADRRRRRYSFAAPERLRRNHDLWTEALAQEDQVMYSAIQEKFPTRRDSWVWRVDRTGQRPPEDEEELLATDWDKESDVIAMHARKNGWRLEKTVHKPDPETQLKGAAIKQGTKTKQRDSAAAKQAAGDREATSMPGATVSSGVAKGFSKTQVPLQPVVRTGSLPRKTQGQEQQPQQQQQPYQQQQDTSWAAWPWQAYLDESGYYYWYNHETGESTWDLPSSDYQYSDNNQYTYGYHNYDYQESDYQYYAAYGGSAAFDQYGGYQDYSYGASNNDSQTYTGQETRVTRQTRS